VAFTDRTSSTDLKPHRTELALATAGFGVGQVAGPPCRSSPAHPKPKCLLDMPTYDKYN